MKLLLNLQLVRGFLRCLVRWRGYTFVNYTWPRLDELVHCP